MEPVIRGRQMDTYHVFIASPGDVIAERDSVRAYFAHLNRTVAQAWGAQFEVVDWESFSTAGVGRPQALITEQTLERFRETLVLVIVIMGQRFGTPTGTSKSGTEEEIRWALGLNTATGFPEVKVFFRDIEQFVAPPDPEEILQAVEQWQRVCRFRKEIEDSQSIFFSTYPAPEAFPSVLAHDLDLWFSSADRPWAREQAEVSHEMPQGPEPPREYFQNLVNEYRWLDIAGIDSDRAFKLPLNKIYVRLRVISSGDGDGNSAEEAAPISIRTALERHPQLAIVGDPGSGKSTFLRFIALTLAQCALSGEVIPALEELSLEAPLPIPLFLPCWDFSEHLKEHSRAGLANVIEFAAERVRETSWQIGPADLETALSAGKCILLIDGLDEVPTEEGRHLVRYLIEKLVEKYPQNRYVVTSRVRAYTGETVLGQQFARCDIQPFGTEERAAFLRNWINQLIQVRDQADPGGTTAATEMNALSHAIETSSIRSLATNPLLLTVIAIVHWNRKRLPEQRVDLYDECIDVLLGQRKQAEQQRISRDTRWLDEEYSEKRLDQQVWIRKRFAEVAFAILNRSDEEIDYAAVVELIEPYFRDTAGGASREKAERFLDQQELRSGLFVRRHSSTYRFVHLTFQEYLAAWHLANRELANTLEVVSGHLRDPKWFETLQLLGGELANRSDEYLDRYVSCMLDQAGKSIQDQAPVIALCANVVRDTQTVAGLSFETKDRFERVVRSTFGAFEPSSHVSKETQLDLLDALGSIGAPAKNQLMAATSSGLLAIRRRALEFLIPHLSDDDLFSMAHLLADRSKEPIKAYLKAIVGRDRMRAGRLVLELSRHGEKTLDALLEAAAPKLAAYKVAPWTDLVYQFWDRFGWDTAVHVIDRWEDRREETWELITDLARQGVVSAVDLLTEERGGHEETWELITGLAREGNEQAVDLLTEERGGHEETWELITGLAREGNEQAIELLVLQRGGHEETWELITSLARQGNNRATLTLVQYRGKREQTWELITELAHEGNEQAIVNLALHGGGSRDAWELVGGLALQGSERAINLLTTYRGDSESTWKLITRLARQGNKQAIINLAQRRGTREETWELIRSLAWHGSEQATNLLAQRRGAREETWYTITDLARQGNERAINLLTTHRDESNRTWELITRLALQGNKAAIHSLVRDRGDRRETWTLITHLDDDAFEHMLPLPYTTSFSDFVSREHRRQKTWELITRLARQGDALAIHMLKTHWGDREETWELIKGLDDRAVERLAGTGNIWGVIVLAKQRGDREEAWGLITRIARQGNAEAIRLITLERGDHQETWELIAQLAEEHVGEAGCLLAWRKWEIATAGRAAV
jgi:hypothetical protein